MNEKSKFAACVAAALAVVGGIWALSGLPLVPQVPDVERFRQAHPDVEVPDALVRADIRSAQDLIRFHRDHPEVVIPSELREPLSQTPAKEQTSAPFWPDVPRTRVAEFPHVVWFPLTVLALATLAHTFEVSRRNLQRTAGVVLLLVGLLIVLGRSSDAAFARGSVLSILNRHGELGLVTLGAGLLILTGGLDLSVGSLVALSAVSFGLLAEEGVPPLAAAVVVVLGGIVIGIGHGLLVTQVGLQAFLVTLCGMFIYRGIARSIQPGQIGRGSVKNELAKSVGPDAGAAFERQFLDLRYWLTGQSADERLVFPALLVVFLLLAAVAAVFLHRSSFGRYWYAIGNNEQAARYAGVTVWQHKVAVFAVCSGLAALAGVVRFLSAGSVTPSVEGDSYELYAITAAVLGGVSLRGGEGTAVGLVFGALVLPVVKPVMNFTKTPSEWEPWLIGLILLGGAIVDEIIRRRGRRAG